MRRPSAQAIEETLHDIARDVVEDAGMSDWTFWVEAFDHGIREEMAWQLRLFKGTGPAIEYRARTFVIPDRVIAAEGIGKLVELFRDEVRYLCWDAKRKHGLVVGQAGKWRKFNRRAA